MSQRPRIDLDGVALTAQDDETEILAIFRYRTDEGLILLMPESGDFLVPWTNIEAAHLDLEAGSISVIFSAEYAKSKGWLRGAHVLAGRWTDRVRLASSDLI